MISVLLLLSTVALAWANGANDVAKGVAAFAGSGIASPRAAWLLGVAGSTAGGLAAIVWGGALGGLFGQGLLSGLAGLPVLAALAALIGAAGFLLIATWLRWPVSTTHALIGGIIGAALATFGPHAVAYDAIARKVLVPLLFSPLIAIALCWLLLRLNVVLEARVPQWQPGCCDPAAWRRDPFVCGKPDGKPARWMRRTWRALHWISGGAVSFARGLNDVPKMAALALPALAALPVAQKASGASLAIGLVSFAMAGGSLMAGRRLLPVLAERVSAMTPTTGLFANLGTAALVLGATPLGLPVSTTHVATGSLIGVRVAGDAPPRSGDALRTIVFAWLVTLPSAASIAAGAALAASAWG